METKIEEEKISNDNRRHSISCGDSRDRSILHSASDSRLPLRILARSLAPRTASGTGSTPAPPQIPSSIDVKFIQMYVKKLGPNFRQNSDPTFNRRHRRQRSSDTNTPVTGGTNSGQSQSSSCASSTDDFPACQVKSIDRKSIIDKPIAPFETYYSPGRIQTIRKSASGNDLRGRLKKSNASSAGSPDFSHPLVECYRILESLFAGGTDAAFNNALLCRLKIDHVIDLRSSTNQPQASSVKGRAASANLGRDSAAPTSLRCVCPDMRHKRQLVNLSINASRASSNSNSNSNSLIDGFKRLNSFITKARVRGEKSLLFDDHGCHTASAAVVQYIMYYYHMRYDAARAFVGEIISDMDISSNVEEALLLWQDEMMSQVEDERSPTACSFHQTSATTELNKKDSPPCIQKKQVAWT